MTKEELIEILEKKGFKRANIYKLEFKLDDLDIYIDIKLWLLSMYSFGDEFYHNVFDYKNMTEQKIDEILSQFTKIKTSLYQIDKIL